VKETPIAGLFVVALGASLAAMDLAVNVAFPSISAAFSLETRSIRWVVICYVLTYSSLMLAFGRLGDRIGHRRVFRAGLLLGVVAYVLCALAVDYPSLLAARIVQGVSTALLLSCAPALATFLFDEDRRLKSLSGYSSLTAVATLAAPLIGGASIAALGWSGVFWFRAPLALLGLALLPLIPHVHPASSTTRRSASDHAGSILLAVSLAFLLLTPALIEPGVHGGFAFLTALIGLAALGAFAKHEQRARDPILSPALIRDPDFVLPNLAGIAVYFVAFAVPLWVPYYLTRVAGYAPFESGAVLALSPAGMLIGSALAAKAGAAFGARRTALLGGTLLAVGSAMIASWSKMPWLPVILSTLALHGAGIGLFQVAYTDIVVAALPRHERGVAGGLTMVMRTVGVMSAVTALTALMQTIERRAVATGASETAAFADAFGTVFLCTASLLAAFFALSGLRRRTWFGR
jgi:MFS family permease